ncbi:DUF5722 domain-containing protein [Fimbriiglobus ruber]|nr:DUF5722 domain-containing protein [Fimbriiglobus ruber]
MVRGLLVCLTSVFLAYYADAASPNTDPFPSPPTKKGLQVQMIDDALALGVGHATLNVDLTRLIDPTGKGNGPRWERAGKSFAISARVVADLDSRVKQLSDKGVVVYLILLPYASGEAARDTLMLHPSYARGQKHAGPIGMFNVVTPDGTAWLTATIEFLATRYSGTGDRGRVWGYIVGNEVNSHWFWANMGRATLAEVIGAYERAVRIVHAAVRTASANARVYLSLDHCWGKRYGAGDDRQCLPGRTFLDEFAAAARKNGDFDWHVAYHPYPEPLTDCRFWFDTTNAPQTIDAPVVTFRNLGVLTDYLAREERMWAKTPRRVILSEQGFHCASRPDGPRDQAAAFALAYVKVDAMPGVDAFILHRHVDHTGEGGLRLGLWTNKPGTVATPDRKRPMYDVFRAAGTAEQDKAFAFALPVLGAKTWADALERLMQPLGK